MADIRVKCISKPDRNSAHEGITHLGGDGWKKTREQVVTDIENRMHTYYTLVDGQRGDLEVKGLPGSKYVRTKPDGTKKDNLLYLPECPR
jgi:hypothetical protein